MSSIRIAYTPLDITPEQARDAHARAWAFVFQCWQEKEKGGSATNRPDDAKEIESDCAANPQYT